MSVEISKTKNEVAGPGFLSTSGQSGRYWFWDIATALCFALVVCGPSIKLFFPYSFLNVLFLALVLFTIILPRQTRPNRTNRLQLRIWVVFSLILLIDLILAGRSVSGLMISRTIYFSLSVAAALLALTPPVVRWLTLILLIWGTFVAIVQIMIGIDYDRGLGQHYLTVSLPIGVALTGTLVAIFVGKFRATQYAMLIGLSGLHSIALATLFSRSAILIPPLVVGIVIIISMLARGAMVNMWRQGVRLLFLGLIALPFIGVIELKQLRRLEELSNIESTSRWHFYTQSFEHIKDSLIFGHGVDASYTLIGTYSHNIFLEVAITGGILLLAPFLMFLAVYALAIRFVITRPELGVIPLMMVGMSLFAVFQWNSSFDLLTAYIPLVLAVAAGALKGSKSVGSIS